ncbi:hypothetical protein [Streptomyces sp. NPDC002685]|uniref:hypothetical protein n=1 Tax=Streptomyces sp. NPDC002685 TaxID=3154540 RepID=UPI00332F60EB
MHARAALPAILLALTAATASCTLESAGGGPPEEPAATPTPAAAASAARQACVDAVATIPPYANGEVPWGPVPDECQGLSGDDYVDAYMDGIREGRRKAQEDLQKLADQYFPSPPQS